jgi:hypothetical protein
VKPPEPDINHGLASSQLLASLVSTLDTKTGGGRELANPRGYDQWSVADWHGKMLLDRNGARIGKPAPVIEMHGEELSQADESTLYHHLELNYAPIGTPSGRRLARR